MSYSPKAVCLFSGGLDSTTTLYYALQKNYDVTALTLIYGQVHSREIESSRRIAERLRISQHIVPFGLPWGGSSLLSKASDIPIDRDEKTMSTGIPSTYVPARNIIFLSLAASLAETLEADTLFLGVNAVDYSGYPDCRPEFLESFSQMLGKGTRDGAGGKTFHIEAPLLRMTKKEIVQLGASLQVPFELTWSCYKGGDAPCGHCDSCILRRKGFEEAAIADPLSYCEKSANS